MAIEGSGNVFADLGLPDAAELPVKADLAIEIGRVLDERDLTQSEAARILRTSQPRISDLRISDLRRGKLEGFPSTASFASSTRWARTWSSQSAPSAGPWLAWWSPETLPRKRARVLQSPNEGSLARGEAPFVRSDDGPCGQGQGQRCGESV
jgi:predicted XRE-type DNA-binding protein